MAATQPPTMSMGIQVGRDRVVALAADGPLEARSAPASARRCPGALARGPVGAEGAGVAVDGVRVEARRRSPRRCPSRSDTPTRKLCSTTSAQREQPLDHRAGLGPRRCRAPGCACPAGRRRWRRRRARMASPPGGSTLITSAPRSARTSAASGPATNAEKSTTRRPSSRAAPAPAREGIELRRRRPGRRIVGERRAPTIGGPSTTSSWPRSTARGPGRPRPGAGRPAPRPGPSTGSQATPACAEAVDPHVPGLGGEGRRASAPPGR